MTTIPASAQTNLASYLFTGGSASATNVTENITASNAVWTGLSGTQFGFSTVNNDAYARFDSVGTTTLNANRYLEFTLSAAPGYFLDLSAIDFIIGYSASGAQTRTNFASVRSSVDSFASDLSMTPGPTTTASIGTNAAVTIYSSPYTVDLSSPTYFGLTNFTFRIYPFVSNAAANNSFSRFDDVNFVGSVSIASYVWTGGSGAWSLAGNWSDSRLGADNGLMVFAGSGGASTNNSVSTIRGLVFSNTAESYTVSGNALTLGLSSAGITNNSGNVQTVLNNLTLSTNAVVSSASGAVVLGGTIALGTNNLAFDAIGAITSTGAISGTGGLGKTGAGTLTLSGNNTYGGTVDVQLGTLELAASSGSAAGSASGITVATGAVLLVSQSGQASDSAAVTLSGGTIVRGSGVTEVFGDLSLSTGSFLDFGTGSTGTLGFGAYTPSSLLTVNNFALGNTLTFGSDLTGTINGALFSFDNAFVSSWDSGTSTFTITAIPEPATYVAAGGLVLLLLSGGARRLLVPREGTVVVSLAGPRRNHATSLPRAV